jgi:hypothetical protein
MTEDQFDAAAASLLDDMYRDIMNEEVPPGLNDDTAATTATTAIQDLLTWARTAEMLLSSHDEVNWGVNEVDGRVFPTVIKLMQGVYHRAQKRCADNHDLSEINNHIIPDARNLELLGVPEIPISELYSCLHFTIQIDSQIHHVESGFSGGFDWHYQASVIVKYASASSAGVEVNGTGPGSYASATGSENKVDHGGCHDGTDIIDTVTLDTPNGNSVSVPQFTFPIASTDPPNIELTLSSSASETYRLDEQDASNPDGNAAPLTSRSNTGGGRPGSAWSRTARLASRRSGPRRSPWIVPAAPCSPRR